MTKINNYAIDRSLHLLANIGKILASSVVLIAVSFLVGLIVLSVSVINSDFFFPQGMFVWYRSDFSAVYFSLIGVSLFVSCACGIYAAEYFYTKALLWEVRMFFRDRVD